MQSKYVVASKKNRTIRSFEDAGQVAVFMLGRRFSEWCIYQRQDDLPADVHACEKVLKAKEGFRVSVVEITPEQAKQVTG